MRATVLSPSELECLSSFSFLSALCAGQRSAAPASVDTTVAKHASYTMRGAPVLGLTTVVSRGKQETKPIPLASPPYSITFPLTLTHPLWTPSVSARATTPGPSPLPTPYPCTDTSTAHFSVISRYFVSNTYLPSLTCSVCCSATVATPISLCTELLHRFARPAVSVPSVQTLKNSALDGAVVTAYT